MTYIGHDPGFDKHGPDLQAHQVPGKPPLCNFLYQATPPNVAEASSPVSWAAEGRHAGQAGRAVPASHALPQQMPLMSILHHGRDIITPTLDDSLPWAEKPHPKHWHARCRQAAFLPWARQRSFWCPVQVLTSRAVNRRKEWMTHFIPGEVPLSKRVMQGQEKAL